MKNHLRHLLLKAEVRKVLSGGDMRFGGTDVAFKRKKEKKKNSFAGFGAIVSAAGIFSILLPSRSARRRH
jgi:hypothetical protein